MFGLFQKVLTYNNQAYSIIADMGEKLSGDFIFDMHYIVSSVEDLKESVLESVKTMNALDSSNSELFGVFNALNDKLTDILDGNDDRKGPSILPLEEISSDHYGIVGGKCSHLAAMIRHMNLRIPKGFCITSNVYHRLIDHNNLRGFIEHFQTAFSSDKILNTEPLRKKLTEAILVSDPPPGLLKELQAHLDRLVQDTGNATKIAVRSSAREEDSEVSFAGQFHTELCVSPDAASVFKAYLKVVASLFSEKALDYRKHFYSAQHPFSIACCCQWNIDAASSGVLHTVNPSKAEEKTQLVSAIWGQGASLVEGSVNGDSFILDKEPPFSVQESEIRKKEPVFFLHPEDGIRECSISPSRRIQSCLSVNQLQELGKTGVEIENYFNRPQDIEWCFDTRGNLFILQSRALRISSSGREKADLAERLSDYPVLMEGQGMTAQLGIASGPVYIAEPGKNLDDVPNGAILVSQSDSSRFVRVMHRASAIITEIGSAVSHMATLCREFQVPCLVNVTGILERVTSEMEITVDAEDRVIYEGRVPELLTYHLTKPIIHERSRETLLLRRLISNISRLHLIDPLMEEFTAEKCLTYHDLLRYIHEKAVLAMVNIGKDDKTLLKKNLVRRLQLPIPTGILVIDIKGGVSPSAGAAKVTCDEIESRPFRAILEGMLHPNVWHQEAMSVGLKDLVRSMLNVPEDLVDGHYTGHNTAVVTRNYVNLCFRFGYHFNIIDAFCDDLSSENHVYFRFLGGATDIVKRSRRARLIADILAYYDFNVKTKGDLVTARIGNKHQYDLNQALNILGRLIGFTRQLDVHMDSDETVDRYVDAFLSENYDIRSIQNSCTQAENHFIADGLKKTSTAVWDNIIFVFAGFPRNRRIFTTLLFRGHII